MYRTRIATVCLQNNGLNFGLKNYRAVLAILRVLFSQFFVAKLAISTFQSTFGWPELSRAAQYNGFTIFCPKGTILSRASPFFPNRFYSSHKYSTRLTIVTPFLGGGGGKVMMAELVSKQIGWKVDTLSTTVIIRLAKEML